MDFKYCVFFFFSFYSLSRNGFWLWNAACHSCRTWILPSKQPFWGMKTWQLTFLLQRQSTFQWNLQGSPGSSQPRTWRKSSGIPWTVSTFHVTFTFFANVFRLTYSEKTVGKCLTPDALWILSHNTSSVYWYCVTFLPSQLPVWTRGKRMQLDWQHSRGACSGAGWTFCRWSSRPHQQIHAKLQGFTLWTLFIQSSCIQCLHKL